MKIKDSFLLKNVAGRMIVVPVGKATLDFNAMITLNDTGAFLFEKLQKADMSVEQLVEALTAEYEVSKETARQDIEKFIENVTAAGITE